MNILDIIVLAILIFFVVRGIFRGFFKEFASLAGFFLGIWLAIHYQVRMVSLLKPYIDSENILHYGSYLLIFISVFLICNQIGGGLRKLVKKTFIGWIDKFLGANIAILKAIIVINLIFVLLVIFIPHSSIITKSRLAPSIRKSYLMMIQVISPDSYKQFIRFLERKKEVIKGIQDITKDGS